MILCQLTDLHIRAPGSLAYGRVDTNKFFEADGRVVEERQPFIRGGVHSPLSREELESKFRGNTAYGRWSEPASARLLAATRSLFDGPVDLSAFRPA